MTSREKATRICHVAIRGRRGFTLSNFILADRQYVEGILEDGTKTRIQLRDGIKVTAMAADCDGDLTDFAHSCHCNESQARVHDVAQQPKPAVYLGAVKSFAQLGQMMIGGR